ncbi:MAG TPA: hypothetical protein VG982_03310 [Candidatus Paceibacterota bacterium]|jgi:hypothetical protein|nr:hypothetical protein [Candidatus Paceibacterota bacterium]
MKPTPYTISITVLVLAIVVLVSVLLAQIRSSAVGKAPYTIGAIVTPTTQMPPGMVMKTFPVPSTEATPTIALEVIHDAMGGYDVHATTTNFSFAPEHLNGLPVAGEGHVHLYIDDHLIIMLGPWYHIDSLTPGPHSIRVGLFNNDHSAYTANGARIEASQELTVPSGNTMAM